MAQKSSLVYSFVARGTVILVELTDFKSHLTSIAAHYLQKLPSSNSKLTYICDGHTFSYLVENGFTYCVVAVDSDGWQIRMAFLERVKEDFNKRYGGGEAATAQANSLNKEFGSILKEHMQYCMDHPDEIKKLAKMNAQQSEVKDAMIKAINEILSRGTACTFGCSSEQEVFMRPRRRKMRFQDMEMKLIVLAIIIALILIIILSVCGGFNSGK